MKINSSQKASNRIIVSIILIAILLVNVLFTSSVLAADDDLYTLNEVNVTGVTLNKTEMQLGLGQTELLVAAITPENADNINATWATDNPGAAVVDEDGIVSAVAVGSATITVTTDDGDFSATCDVEVIELPGVTLDKEEMELCIGETGTLTETVSPEDAPNKDVSWISGSPSVATVEGGVVTAVSLGSAIITVTTNSGGYTDTCTVSVKSADIASSVYIIEDGLIQEVAKNTSAGQFIANLSNDYDNLIVFDKDGAEYTGTSVATGMSVKLTINEILRDELTIAVLGDGNGDGDISITDYTLARLDILNLKSLSGEFRSACDINGDGNISITDYTLMRLDILGLKEITEKVSFTIDIDNPQILAFLTMALAQQGDPYVWGDEGPDSFDCSGFIHYCLNQVGYSIWRSTANTYSKLERWTYVTRANLQPGDLMFYKSDSVPNHIGHVGIYLGNGYHIHASSTYQCVIICQMDGWYDAMFSHGRRVF